MELSCKKKNNLMHIVGKNQAHYLRDSNPWEGAMPKDMASSKVHLKLHLSMIWQDVEMFMLNHLVTEQRG